MPICSPFRRATRRVTVAGFLVCAGAAQPAAGQISFSNAGFFGTGATPIAIATGDFDSNGRLDLAIANQGGQSVTIIRFGASSATVSTVLLSSSTPTGIFTGEVTCTAGLDLAVSTSNSTIKFLSNSGTGAFTLLPDGNNIAQGSPGVVVSDFNGDGKPSVVGTTADQNTPGMFDLASRSGQGTGDGCGGYQGQDTTQTVGTQPAAIALGSFNTIAGGILPADTFPDILVANAGAGTVSVMLYSGEAPGGGAPGGIVTTLSQTVTVGANPVALVTGQFNPGTDAFTDFAVVCAGDRSLRIFFGTGRGTFNAGPVILLTPGPTAIATGDLNGDGIADLAVTSTGALPTGVNPSFTGVGNLGTATPSSTVTGVSPDGLWVVGAGASTSGNQAFRWSQAGGIVGIGDLAGGRFDSVANAVSPASAVVVGAGASAASGTFSEAFRWTSAGGFQGLGDFAPDPDFNSEGTGITDDGLTIVGTGHPGTVFQAFRWTQGTGLVSTGALPGTHRTESHAAGVSANGAVIVGSAASETSGAEMEAFRWTAATGMVGLGDFHGGAYASRGLGVSADGNTVVGWGSVDTAPLGPRMEPFKWTPQDGLVSLGTVTGGTAGGMGWDACANGSVIVGQCNIASGGDAFRWTHAEGMKKVRDLLVAAGVSNLSTWSLKEARAISDDGTLIAGNGINPSGRPEGWVARLPVPPVVQVFTGSATGAFTPRAFIDAGRSPTAIAIGQFAGGARPDVVVTSGLDNQVTIYENTSCPADFDANGLFQPADVSAFVNAWITSINNGTLGGDFDHDGVVQPADVSFFVASWFSALVNGC